MANIINVDYEAIPRQAQSMRAKGKEINSELVSVYNLIAEMHNSWYGVRYNELVGKFNNDALIANLNELLELVVGSIPFTLEQVANNYSLADRGTTVTSAINEAPKKIIKLNISNDIGLKFVTSEVTATQTNITKKFQNATELMNQVEAEYSKISWQSEASEAFRAKFGQLKTNIMNSFAELNSAFSRLMEQTKADIEKTENSNKV